MPVGGEDGESNLEPDLPARSTKHKTRSIYRRALKAFDG